MGEDGNYLAQLLGMSIYRLRLYEYSKHRCAICIMQSIPHTKFLECLVDVGSLLGPFVPDFEVPV